MRTHSIRALGQIGDKGAIPSLVEIIEEGENTRNFSDTLYNLSQLGHEPIRPYVLERLQRNRGFREDAVGMIKFIGKKEDIALLEEMYNNVQGDDVNARLERKGLRDAIDAINVNSKLW